MERFELVGDVGFLAFPRVRVVAMGQVGRWDRIASFSLLSPLARFEVGGEFVQVGGDGKHGGPRGSGG